MHQAGVTPRSRRRGYYAQTKHFFDNRLRQPLFSQRWTHHPDPRDEFLLAGRIRSWSVTVVGKCVALRARRMGLNVIVCEVDPIKVF